MLMLSIWENNLQWKIQLNSVTLSYYVCYKTYGSLPPWYFLIAVVILT